MKTPTILVSLTFSLFLVGACSPGSVTDNSPGGGLALLSNGPDLPDECVPCWDDFQGCFADGNDSSECADQIIECVEDCQAPPPPPECLHCAAGFDACANAAQGAGESAEDCAVGFEGCLSACEGDSECEENTDNCQTEPPGGECGACDQHFDDCINDEWQNDGEEGQGPNGDTQFCEQVWNDCLQHCDGEDGGGNEGEDICDKAQDACANGEDGGFELPDGDFVSCQDIIDACTDPTDPGDPNQPPSEECDLCTDAQTQCDENADPAYNCEEIDQYCSQYCSP